MNTSLINFEIERKIERKIEHLGSTCTWTLPEPEQHLIEKNLGLPGTQVIAKLQYLGLPGTQVIAKSKYLGLPGTQVIAKSKYLNSTRCTWF